MPLLIVLSVVVVSGVAVVLQPGQLIWLTPSPNAVVSGPIAVDVRVPPGATWVTFQADGLMVDAAVEAGRAHTSVDPNKPTGGPLTLTAVARDARGAEVGRATQVVLVIKPAPRQAPGEDPVLVGAGDIASCHGTGDEQTVLLLDTIAGTVFTLGDNAYESGTAVEFADCYGPSWGRHLARTRPTPGNHDYRTAGAAGYFAYFGDRAGASASGYYSYDIGAWHVVVLNSNCVEASGCDVGSPQLDWLRHDLDAHPTRCTLAYWHHPRFSSGRHGDNAFMQPIWSLLVDYGVDLALTGHDHDYERFAPLNAAGQVDPNGMRQFVVGTGGRSLRPVVAALPGSEVRSGDAYGVLKLTLHPDGYDWAFIPVAGATFTDAGSGRCH